MEGEKFVPWFLKLATARKLLGSKCRVKQHVGPSLQDGQNYCAAHCRVQLIFYSSTDGKRMPLFPSAFRRKNKQTNKLSHNPSSRNKQRWHQTHLCAESIKNNFCKLFRRLGIFTQLLADKYVYVLWSSKGEKIIFSLCFLTASNLHWWHTNW